MRNFYIVYVMSGEIQYALRLMRRSPALTAVAIGASAAAIVFAAVKGVLLQPFL